MAAATKADMARPHAARASGTTEPIHPRATTTAKASSVRTAMPFWKRFGSGW